MHSYDHVIHNIRYCNTRLQRRFPSAGDAHMRNCIIGTINRNTFYRVSHKKNILYYYNYAVLFLVCDTVISSGLYSSREVVFGIRVVYARHLESEYREESSNNTKYMALLYINKNYNYEI